MKPKYLVRPSDYSIFDLDESNGCYRVWSSKPLPYRNGKRSKAMKHFTFENLTTKHKFFPIDESQIEFYEKRCNEHYELLLQVYK